MPLGISLYSVSYHVNMFHVKPLVAPTTDLREGIQLICNHLTAAELKWSEVLVLCMRSQSST